MSPRPTPTHYSRLVEGRFGPSERVVVASHPLATEAAHNILDAGGTVVDAAVSAAAVLTVVDPRSTGIGGDLFAMVWPEGEDRPIGLNAAGCAPSGMTVAALQAEGFRSMPQTGPWSVTVPGAVDGWRVLLGRYGRLEPGRVLEPAVRAAVDGFRITPAVAREWAATVDKLSSDVTASAVFLADGRPPAAGERWANPDYGQLLQRLGQEGWDIFYRGDVAQTIATAVEAAGGPLRFDDLAGWEGTEWVEALTVEFGGWTIHELPPPGQGLVALIAIALYELLPHTDAADAEHAAIEAVKVAFREAYGTLADPAFADVPVLELLHDDQLRSLARAVDMTRAAPGQVGPATDTVYLAVADAEQGGCSLIQSLYEGFGSGLGVPGLGLTLQNRGGCFELDDAHPNRPEPGKRPYNTIMPAMLSDGGRFTGCMGVVGGFMQPQGHLQVLRNVVERGMTPQEAVDAPRLRVFSGRAVGVEQGFDADVLRALSDRGHEIGALGIHEAGGAQLILRSDDHFLGGSDRRKDGHEPL